MRLKKNFFIHFTILLLFILITINNSSHAQKKETITFTGLIKSISYNSILVNEVRILISSDTKVSNERGESLKLQDLKKGLYVWVDTVKTSEGFLANKIVIKELKGV